MTSRRARKPYFEREDGAPPALSCQVERRVRFNEVDPMGIVWFGRYPLFFEEGAAELGRRCGLSYQDFMSAGVMAPVASYHVDYVLPLYLDEVFRIVTTMVWSESARINTEYELIKADGTTAARAYTVQMLINAQDRSVYWVSPPLVEACRQKWRAGGFKDLET